MSESDNREREEFLRLREENLRLREDRLMSAQTNANKPTPPPTVNVKQVNEGCMAGCGSLIGLFVILAFVLKACGG